MNRSGVHTACGVLGMSMLLAGCSLTHVSTSHDPATRFSKLRDYQWLKTSEHEERDADTSDPDLDRHVRNAVDRALQSHGYRERGEGIPDFYVDYQLNVRSGVEMLKADDPDAGPAGVLVHSYLPESDPGRQAAVWGVGPPKSYAREFNQRAVLVEIMEPGTARVIWRGSAETEVRDRQSRELQYRQIDEAVRKALRDFPPQ